jgi:hypothetical protein
MLIPSITIAVISLLASLVMLEKRQWDNAFTRFCVTLFYLTLAVDQAIAIETARELNRWFWVLVLGVEVLWWVVTKILRRGRGH